MLNALMRGIRVVTNAGANARHLIGGDDRSYTAAADHHSALGPALEDRTADRFGVVWVIHRSGVMGAEIFHVMAKTC